VVCLFSPLPHRCGASLCALLAAGLVACSSESVENALDSLPGIAPYRIEIQQGNYVSQDMVNKLKRGMSREQVRFVLGTPLLTDMFHANRWDYVFFREIPNKPREERRFSVFFENDRLVRVAGDVAPESRSAAPSSGAQRQAANGQEAEAAKSEEAKSEEAKAEAAKAEAAKPEAAKAEAAKPDTSSSEAPPAREGQ
jgi:outer membrane protein assembly factor BamE